MKLSDDRRQVTGLRKQFIPNIKGKLFLLVEVSINGARRLILGESSPHIFNRDIEKQRAITEAKFNIMYLGVNRYQKSDLVAINILNWGVKYGNNQVKVKRVSVKGRYRTMVWVKGRRGVAINKKWTRSTNTFDEIQQEYYEDEI
ncbi:MAG: hypothetical protein ACOCZ5_01155 [bacterium]